MKTPHQSIRSIQDHAPSLTRLMLWKRMMATCLAVMFCQLKTEAQSISQGLQFLGNQSTEVATAIAIAPDKSSIIGGTTTSGSGSKDAFIIWQQFSSPVAPRLSKTYSLGNGDLEITAIESALPSGSIAVVANRTGGTGTPDALFLHINSSGTILGSRFWASTLSESLNDVISLPDGSFVVVGRLRGSDATCRSFVARVGDPSQNYSLIWARTMGNLSGFASAADEAVAIKQLPDGNLLVTGFTDQGATTTQGAAFLWKLDLSGNTVSLQRLTLDPSLIRPKPTDMTILNTGAIAICGNSQLNSFGPIKKGWIMRLDANLTNPLLRTVVYTGFEDQHLEFRALDANPQSNEFWVAGKVEVPIDADVDVQGLMVGFNEFLTPIGASEIGFNGVDEFNDVRYVQLGTSSFTSRAAGFSDLSHARFLPLQNGDAFLAFGGEAGAPCSNDRFFSIQLEPKTATLASMTLTINTTMTTTQVLPSNTTISIGATSGCNPLRLAGSTDQSDEHQASDESQSEF
ncbi:MAG: hypothetical protein U0176_16810 [Bacteroidia bacterium]